MADEDLTFTLTAHDTAAPILRRVARKIDLHLERRRFGGQRGTRTRAEHARSLATRRARRLVARRAARRQRRSHGGAR